MMPGPIPVIVIRPQPGNAATVSDARALGLDPRGFPLFEVRPLPWEPPARADFDALLIGSANAIRHAGAALSAYKGMPAYAVGEVTAEAARGAGLDVIAAGSGGLQHVLDSVRPEHQRLLRLAGRRRTVLSKPDEMSIMERVVYTSNPVPMPAELVQTLREPAVVLLHSGEAARHFEDCCREHAIDRSHVALAAIGARVADAAGSGWGRVATASEPNDAALLALAKQLCQEHPGLGKTQRPSTTQQGPMQDDTTPPAASRAPPTRRGARGQLLVALLGFLLGALLIAYLGWRGYLQPVFDAAHTDGSARPLAAAGETPPAIRPAPSAMTEQERLAAVGSIEGRLAMLEDRLSRLDLQASAASGNAARAESLLIAFATRRMIERGEPLRYLADQLRLRFANAQPRAVATIIAFSEDPVTIDQLSARLEALGPELTGRKADARLWTRFTREFSDLFVIRRDSSSVLAPEARVERARMMLTARRIPDAIRVVSRMPGAVAADRWIMDARRYAEMQSALDLIETAAMLERTRLQDGEGNRISQPSPLETTAPTEAPETPETP